MSVQSHACCTVPAVVTHEYNDKGKFISVAGLNTYATGPSSAKKGVLVIYDIFGFFPQTKQGADIIASGDKENAYQVFMPDWFEGEYADVAWYPPKDDESGKKLGEFFQTKAAPPKTLSKVPKVMDELKQLTGIQTWAIVGYCWGGKIVNLLSFADTQFKAAAVSHPAMVDAGDGEKTSIPFLMLPSGDEDRDAVKKWDEAVKVPHTVKFFDDQVHGWMAARADLANDNVRQAYETGYKMILDWFHEHV